MKKRRPCTGNNTSSPVNSPRGAVSSVASGSISLRSKSFQDLKRRRLQRKNVSRQSRGVIDDDAARKNFCGVKKKKKKKDAFGSLESLFDVKRPIKLPEVVSWSRYTDSREPDEYSTSNDDSPRNHYTFITDLYRSPNRLEGEPDVVAESWDSLELSYKSDASKLEEPAFDIIEEGVHQEWDEREGSLIVDGYQGDMADEDERVDKIDDVVPEPSAPPEEENAEPEVEKVLTEEPRVEDTTNYPAMGETKEVTAKPPEYELPVGVGEGNPIDRDTSTQPVLGVPPKSGGRSESIISTTPLTDSKVISALMEGDRRCKIVGQEMEDIRKQIEELKHVSQLSYLDELTGVDAIARLKSKEDITDEDAQMIKEKQASLMKKMQEFDDITRNIQRVVGLADPSSQTFARMFDMLPYPHGKTAVDGEKIMETKDKPAGSRDERVAETFQHDRFDPPQPEYPEDKLPRAIVCGFTEDRIPKIVIPDSRPKSARCLKKLTGKLSESLNMQEKLVEENAKLEGGKYKLEEALLEKDNTVDSLQRRVCSLQAEIRIVVKENTELTQQLSSLTANQRSTGSPVCCFTCPGQLSPQSTNRHQSSYSRSSTPRRDDEFCRCLSCMRGQSSDSGALHSNTVCVNSDGYDPYTKPCAASPRLSGGGSREDGCSYSNPSTERGSVMCCRGPATGRPPGALARSGACPAEMENTMRTYGNDTNQLAQQLDSMESEVRNMQIELANVHKERQQLEQQRKLLKCTGPCAPCSCCPPGMSQASSSIHQPMMVPCVAGASQSLPSQIPDAPVHVPVPISLAKMGQQQQSPSCSGVCVDAPMGGSTCPQQQLRDLREQYARLQEDYRNKLCEVSCLRADADKMKQETREAREERERAENRLIDAQERLKIMETEKNRFHGSKEQLVEQEQALLVAKQRYREAQDELEELRSMIQDQANQLEDYRNKYLQAQEQVEEQRRQLDLMEMDNARMNQNVNLEIGKVKNHFLGKLAEFAPLADIVKQTQAKLQEVQQMRIIAERNCEDLTRELLTCKDQLGTMQSQLHAMRSANSALNDEKGMGSGRCEELEKKNSELRIENERMKNTISRLEEQESQLQKRVDEKTHEIVQLTAMLEQVREDSARQVARTKERCETVRRSMQGQIAEMEKQLAQCRATARAAQKDRDEIRQKMQGQINNLNEAFEQAQGRIRSLQGHVNYLKTSYSNIFSPGAQGEGPGFMPSETAGQGQGYDSCDCNY